MKFVNSIAIFLSVLAPLASAKNKKKDILPAVFSNARYVYVQAEDGDIMKPGLFPEDREAIANVQDALKNWNRYALTLNRKDADSSSSSVAAASPPLNCTEGSRPEVRLCSVALIRAEIRRVQAVPTLTAPAAIPISLTLLTLSAPELKLAPKTTHFECFP